MVILGVRGYYLGWLIGCGNPGMRGYFFGWLLGCNKFHRGEEMLLWLVIRGVRAFSLGWLPRGDNSRGEGIFP